MARLKIPLDSTKTGREALALETELRTRIVGQDEAIRHIVNVYQMYLTGLNTPGRPVANFLFLGPTGSGKTRMVEATAESLAGTADAVVKIDCGEFQHSHEIAKLIGSPPGYLGHRESHPMLSQEVLDQYHTDDFKLSFVLFDEIEKASDAVWNLLLGILDKGTLTLGDNRKVDFSHCMIFLTSNLGAREMSAIASPRLGFNLASGPAREGGKVTDKVKQAGLEAARRKFTPEFINRLDKIVVFQPLGERELRAVLDIELDRLRDRLERSSSPFALVLTAEAKDYLLSEGTDTKYGARHLKRAIDRLLVQPVSNLIATGQVHGGDILNADFDADLNRIIFFKEADGLAAQVAAEAPAMRIAAA